MKSRVCSFFLAAAVAFSTNGAAMADQELTFQTWCIGRHTVEVPTHFEPLENYGTINAMTLETLGPGDSRTLEDYVTRRAKDLSSGAVTQEGVPLLFRGQYQQGDARVLAHELDIGQAAGSSFTWTEEAYVLREGEMMRVVQVLSEDEEDGPRAQMLELAGQIAPHTRDTPPKSAGACLPQAIAAIPPTTEVHGITFVPRDADGAPVGLEISIVSRSAEDPPLDLEGDMPQGRTAQPIEIAGMEGIMVADPEQFGPSKLAVVTRTAKGATPALRVEIHYYDDRPERGVDPYPEADAQQIWDRAIGSFRARSAP